jgi:hypothetical protein
LGLVGGELLEGADPAARRVDTDEVARPHLLVDKLAHPLADRADLPETGVEVVDD